jgi:RNA polymerase sigma-70 factor (ECF subfamily)
VIAAVAKQTDVADAYREHAADLIRYATVLVGPSDAQDVVSDAVLAVFAGKQWANVDNPRAYLFRAVLNQSMTHHRSGARRRRREQRAASSDVLVAHDTTSIDAHRALAHLSEQQRAVVYLTYWEDLSVVQIATLLDVSEGTVKKQLARARDQLRRILDA